MGKFHQAFAKLFEYLSAKKSISLYDSYMIMYKLSYKKRVEKTSIKGIEKNIAFWLEKMGYKLVIFIIATFEMG